VENFCECGEELQPGIDYCSEECCIKYALNDNEDDLLYNSYTGEYYNIYGDIYFIES
jgi:hypothetical protein